jgi:hypothetical protein
VRITTTGEAHVALRSTQHIVLLLAAAALYGCAGSQPKQTGDENNFNETPSSSTSASPAPDTDAVKWSATPSPKAAEASGLTPDQKAQMEIALRRGGDKAANCASVVPDGPKGEGEVTVTFDGKKGRSVDAKVGPPFAGTAMEACIKRSFIGEIVVPFDGDLDVPYTVKVGVKGGSAPAESKDKKK